MGFIHQMRLNFLDSFGGLNKLGNYKFIKLTYNEAGEKIFL